VVPLPALGRYALGPGNDDEARDEVPTGDLWEQHE
jgi:hypothetical protein